MTTVACVLRSGGRYTYEWVEALERRVVPHMPEGWTFTALVDAHPWPGWWAKMGLLEPGRFVGPVLYLDLDTDIVAPLDWFGFSGDLALLSDFYRPRLGQSGVMAFNPGPETERLWRLWMRNADRYMARYRGDGEWLHFHAPQAPRLQTLYPGRIVSHKVDCASGVPDGASIVCYHGEPKRYPDGVVRAA